MEPLPAKPPHQKLQNDAAGIEIEFGSIYVIPAPTDYMDDDVGSYDDKAPHQLINFGPSQEKVLIIPDYRVNHVVPGISRKSLINSDQMVKLEPKSEKASSSPSNAPSVSSQSVSELTEMLSQDFRTKNQVNENSPLTVLTKFEGAEGAVLLDMFASWDVKTLKDIPSFPFKHPEGVIVLVEADMFPDIVQFAEKISFLISNPPPIVESSPESQMSATSSFSANMEEEMTKDLSASQILPPKDDTVPISQVPGVTPAVASILSRYALIQTSKDLVNLPKQFPGIYTMMKDVNEVPNLEEIISAASAFSSAASGSLNSHSVQSPSSENATIATSSLKLQNLGEAQRVTVKIEDISRNSLVGALKGMSHDLAFDLRNQYPPIESLQALATFAEVSPTEFTYLKRKYPELPELCQQAALLVSVASGHPHPRPL